ncbi:hypothetical protein AVEN_235338-1 [Araneus ventricosus]|uniref:Uncharacterized protein n=1 Tax=Araneus ventricosus TaxID=182803 RepID=A0A4Y2A3L9_ARAVE|nr:hypothetical protein AVEN_235338-1 [Araneus ventricosus]
MDQSVELSSLAIVSDALLVFLFSNDEEENDVLANCGTPFQRFGARGCSWGTGEVGVSLEGDHSIGASKACFPLSATASQKGGRTHLSSFVRLFKLQCPSTWRLQDSPRQVKCVGKRRYIGTAIKLLRTEISLLGNYHMWNEMFTKTTFISFIKVLT